MRIKKKEFLLNLFRIIFKEFNLLDVDDVISIGKFRIFIQILLSKLEGRKDFYALMPISSKVIDIKNIKINGNLYRSNLMRSLISSNLYLQAINGIEIDSALIGPTLRLLVQIISKDFQMLMTTQLL